MQNRRSTTRPTQRTIAEKAGISVDAVSRALSNDPLMAAETRARVQRIAQRAAPDGLILPGQVSGLAALAAIRDLGLTPGRYVHLVVKQTSGVFDFVRPHVSSFREDLSAAGKQLVNLLLRRLAGEPAEALRYLQPISGGLGP